MKFLGSTIFLLLVVQVLSKDEDDPKISDLPEGSLEEIIRILKEPESLIRGMCNDPDPDLIQFLLYTKNYTDEPLILNSKNLNEIDENKQLVLVIHGWVAGATAYGIQELKDALLKDPDTNVVIVNWKALAWQLYAQSVCQLPKIAKIVAEFLCAVSDKTDINIDDVTLMGHSLGGQMSGLIGQETLQTCRQRVGKIIGMDPAGPLFFGVDKSERLDASDAKFVQAIHTNGGKFGYLKNCGHVDFYVNCGSLQANCLRTDVIPAGLLNMPISVVACPHLRALDYTTKSIDTVIAGNRCRKCPLACPPFDIFGEKIRMGYHTRVTARGPYYVNTINLDLDKFDIFRDTLY